MIGTPHKYAHTYTVQTYVRTYTYVCTYLSGTDNLTASINSDDVID